MKKKDFLKKYVDTMQEFHDRYGKLDSEGREVLLRGLAEGKTFRKALEETERNANKS